VTNQLKILPTAAFSVLALNRSLRLQQWLSLPLLALGVAVVNLSASAHVHVPLAEEDGAGVIAAERVTLQAAQREPRWWVGLAAALAAAVFSGYASVYVERMLKTEQRAAWAEGDAESGGGGGGGNGSGGACGSGNGNGSSGSGCSGAAGGCASPGGGGGGGGGSGGSPKTGGMQAAAQAASSSACGGAAPGADAPLPPPHAGGRPLLSLNLQLAAWGAAISLLQLTLFNAPELRAGALLQHFNAYTWAVIWLQALGGLVVGVVLKYTDNIVKGFATAASILLSFVLESGMSGRMPSFSFVLGLCMVMASFALFSGPEDLLARLLGPTGHALLAAAAADVGAHAMGCVRVARAPPGAGALLAAAAAGAGALTLMAMYVHDTSAAGSAGVGVGAGGALLRAPPVGFRAPPGPVSSAAAAAALHAFGVERPPMGPLPEGISSEAGGAGIAAGGGSGGGVAASHDDGGSDDAPLRAGGIDAAAAAGAGGAVAVSGAGASGVSTSSDDATGVFAARMEAAEERARAGREGGDAAAGAAAARVDDEFAAVEAAEDAAAAAAAAAAVGAGAAAGASPVAAAAGLGYGGGAAAAAAAALGGDGVGASSAALRGVVVNASVRAGGVGFGSASQAGLLPAPSTAVVGPRDAWLAERAFAEGGLDPAEVAAASAAAAAADAAGRGLGFGAAAGGANATAAAMRDELRPRAAAAAARHAARDAAALGVEPGALGGGGIAGGAGKQPAEGGERLTGAAAWLATATDQGGAVRTTVRRRLRSGEQAEAEATCGAAGGGEAC
jgi:hypothetical protein